MSTDIPLRSLCLKHTEDIVMVKTKIESIDEKIDNVDCSIKCLHKDFKEFKNGADNKYASKNVERVVYGLIAIVGMTIISAFLKLVIL